MHARRLLGLLLTAVLGVGATSAAAAPDISCRTPRGAAALACRYQPILIFAPGEPYHARPVEILLQPDGTGPAMLRIGDPPVASVALDGTLRGLAAAEKALVAANPQATPLFVDAPEPSTDVAAQQAAQDAILAGTYGSGSFPPVQYVNVRSLPKRLIAIQYWFFYYADALPLTCIPKTQTHEGDWEHIDVILKRRGSSVVPIGIDYGWHSSSSTIAWRSLQRRGSHAAVYVASGSHASYPFPGPYVVPSRFLGSWFRCLTDVTAPAGPLPRGPAEGLRWLRSTTPGFAAGDVRLLFGEEPAYPDIVVDEGPLTPVHQGPFRDPLGAIAAAPPLAVIGPAAAICAPTGQEPRLVGGGRVLLGYGGPSTSTAGRYVRSLPFLGSGEPFPLDRSLANRCTARPGRGVWNQLLLAPGAPAYGDAVSFVATTRTRAVGRRDVRMLCDPSTYPTSPLRTRGSRACSA